MSVITLTVSNSQVYSNDEFDIWPVYSGERFRAFRPSCFKFFASLCCFFVVVVFFFLFFFFFDEVNMVTDCAAQNCRFEISKVFGFIL